MESRIEMRKKEYKKTFDDPRRRREEQLVQIRKQGRESQLTKKRQQALDSLAAVPGASTGGVPGPQSAETRRILPEMLRDLMSSNYDDQFRAAEKFRRLLSIEAGPPIQEVIDAGAVTRLIEFLKDDSRPELQFEAAWALTNIASGDVSQTRTVTDGGAVPVFVRLLSSEVENVREQAVWALGNIAGDCTACRNHVLSEGGLAPLLRLLQGTDAAPPKFSMLRNGTWTLSNLCRGKPEPPFEWVCPALPTLHRLIHSQDVEVLADACWALSYLSDVPDETAYGNIEALIRSDIVPGVVRLLRHPSHLVQTPALRTIGNIVTGDDRQTQIVISCSALDNLMVLLRSPHKSIKKEACWTVSNITAGNRNQIQEIINAGLIPPIIHLLEHGELEVKREAVWAISNAASGGVAPQVNYLVEAGCVKPICDLLEVEDAKIQTVALEALEHILKMGSSESRGEHDNAYTQLVEEAGGFARLEALQDTSSSQHMQQTLYRIMTRYLKYEEVDEMEDAEPTQFEAAAPEGGFKFG